MFIDLLQKAEITKELQVKETLYQVELYSTRILLEREMTNPIRNAEDIIFRFRFKLYFLLRIREKLLLMIIGLQFYLRSLTKIQIVY